MITTRYQPEKDDRPSKPCLVCQAQIKAPYGWHRYGCTCSKLCHDTHVAPLVMSHYPTERNENVRLY